MRFPIFVKAFVAFVLCFLAGAAAARDIGTARAADEHRVALVIGNAAYPSQPLVAPINDATDIAAKLKALGFEVTLRTNATLKEMTRAITRFGEQLRPGSVALFYYAGHGIQVRGRNFLVPIDAEIGGEAAVRSESVDVDQLLEQFQSSRVSVVILDACRNNPFERRFRSGRSSGLAQIDAPKGTLIAYATAPGKTAAEGSGRNGLYTKALLKAMDIPGQTLENVFKQVRIEVARESDDAQIPWEASSLTGDFYFQRELPQLAAPKLEEPARSPAQIEDALWESIREQKKAAVFEEYIRQFPNGRYVALARIRLVALQETLAADDEPTVWRSIEASATAADYEAYLAQYPNGRYAKLAKARLKKLAAATAATTAEPSEAELWRRAESSRDPAIVQAYLSRFPSGRNAGKARTRLVELRRQQARLAPGTSFRDCPTCPEMTVVPGGRFAMGSSAGEPGRFNTESPRHEVLIARPFAIGKTEVTQGEWRSLMASNPSHFAACGDQCPVEMVSREDAREFARRLSAATGGKYRLPSEAEWEYACRAGRDVRYCGGDSLEALAWHAGNSRAPQPVRGRQPNAFGLYDMSGNVAEWVADCWSTDYRNAPADGSAVTAGERCDVPVLRGGSWLSEDRYLRAAQRLKAPVEAPRGVTLGFRLVRDLN